MEYSSGRQEGELPVAYREYDRFYNGASREGDSRGEIYEADDTEQSVENMIMMQLPWKTFTEEQHRIVKFCIHSLDQNGYLTVPPSEIAEALKAEVSEVEYIVSRLKELEPVGIFASSLERVSGPPGAGNGAGGRSLHHYPEPSAGCGRREGQYHFQEAEAFLCGGAEADPCDPEPESQAFKRLRGATGPSMCSRISF